MHSEFHFILPHPTNPIFVFSHNISQHGHGLSSAGHDTMMSARTRSSPDKKDKEDLFVVDEAP